MGKILRRQLCALLAGLLLASAVPAFAAGGLSAQTEETPETGLFGAGGPDESTVDWSAYDAITGPAYIKDGSFVWPAQGYVLIRLGGTVESTLKSMIQGMHGREIPAGVLVDVYYTNSSVGSIFDRGYLLAAHYDTTDGQPETIDATAIMRVFDEAYGTHMAPPQTEPEQDEAPLVYTKSFTDVSPGAWYYDAVMTLAENGIVNGYGGGRFGPDDSLTLQQLLTILRRVCGEEAYDSYDPGENPWYARIATRGEAAYLMTTGSWSSRQYENSYYNIITQNTLDNMRNQTLVRSIDDFADADDIRRWSVEYSTEYIDAHPLTMDTVEHMSENVQGHLVDAYNEDLFKGIDDKPTFAPYAHLTRAELCQALYRAGIRDVITGE